MGNYNVDDILEEVKRKRARESASRQQGYGAPYDEGSAYGSYGQRQGMDYGAPPRRSPAPEGGYPPQQGYPMRESYPPQQRYPGGYQQESYGEYSNAYPYSRNYDNGYAQPRGTGRMGEGGYPPMERQGYPEERYGGARESYYPPTASPYPQERGFASDRFQDRGFDMGRNSASTQRGMMSESDYGTPYLSQPPVPPAPTPPQSVSRRTPKPSMDDLLQNFGEGVGLGKGIDPKRPPIQPRRSPPMIGKSAAASKTSKNTGGYPSTNGGYTPPSTAYSPAPSSGSGFHFQVPAQRQENSYPQNPSYPGTAYPQRADRAPSYPQSRPFSASPEQYSQAGYPPAQETYSPPPTPSFEEPSFSRTTFSPQPGGFSSGESFAPQPGYPAGQDVSAGTEPYFTQEPFSSAAVQPLGTGTALGEQEAPAPMAPETGIPVTENPEPVKPTAENPPFSAQGFSGGSMDFSGSPTSTAASTPFAEAQMDMTAEVPIPPVGQHRPEGPGVSDEVGGATRMADLDESDTLYHAPMPRIALSPEDTQDDVDYDADGNLIDAASSEDERRAILHDIKRVRVGLTVRLGLTLAAFLGLFYLGLSYINPDVPAPPFMWAEGETMRTFLIINVAILAIIMLVNSSVVGGGLVSLFTFKADNDSLVSLALVASVVQGVALIITPDAANVGEGIHLYYCIPVLGLLFNLLGKHMMMRRIAINGRLVLGEGEKYVMRTIQSEDFSRELSRGLPTELPEITYSVKTKYVSNFLQSSYAQDYAESINRVLVLICLLASIAVSVISYFVVETGSVYLSMSILSGLLAICAPFTATLVGNMPMLRAARKLQKCNAVIAGYPVVEEYSAVKAATFKVKELFPEDSISLSAMKVFQENLIEQAILDAASVICATDSPLAPIFKNMIASNEKILKAVENIVYEDEMGLSAWVDGKRVLIGNAQLMHNHGIQTPSRDYEERYVGEGKQILYLSNSGELTAMFALTYSANPRVAAQMKELADHGVSLIVHSTDPNLTAKRLSQLYNYPEPYIKIVPASLHADYDRLIAPRTRAKASIIYNGTIMSMFRALGIIPRIKSAVTAGTVCQLLSTLIGYAIITFFAFFAGMSNISFTVLLCYQLAWTVVTVVVSNLRKI